jgi:AraC-like DNA-binding protein
MAETEFALMTVHGEAMRPATPGGRVIFSRLSGGSSAIHAATPSLKFVLEGQEIYETAGRTRRLGPGDFMLVGGGQEVKVRTSRTETSVGMCIYLDAAPAPVAEAQLGAANLAGSAWEPLACVMNRYASILWQRPEAGTKLARLIHREVGAAVEDYLGSVHGKVQRMSSIKHSTRIETLQRLERARAFMHDHAGRHLTLEEIAGHAALSRFHLTRSFAEVFGVPPLAYHRALRLEWAAERLRRGEASATLISEELGYGSLSAFTRAFRHRYGVPPSQVRQAA